MLALSETDSFDVLLQVGFQSVADRTHSLAVVRPATQASTSVASPAMAQSPTPAVNQESSSAGPRLATPVALQPATLETATPEKKEVAQPFADWDWTWLNGNPRTKEIFWDSKFFTPEIRADIKYVADFNHPADHSMGGSSELFRSQEVQLEQLGGGGDFHYDNVRARLMTQFGMYSGRIEGEQAAKGIVIALPDLLIGVTALHLGYSVATLNVRHSQLIPSLSAVRL